MSAASLTAAGIVAAHSASASTWPSASGTVKVSSTIEVSGTFDGGLKRYYGTGDGSQDENQDPMFTLADGATIQNVIVGAPAGDGIHCKGSCTIKNVWWEDVGEDAATFKGGDSAKYTVSGGGAKKADDKVFQHNGGGTLTIKGFTVDDFGKLYRSCGNCSKQYRRNVVISDVTASDGSALAGINTNYGDTATFSAITIRGDQDDVDICVRYQGNDDGDEPTKLGSGADGKYCRYSDSDITFT